MHIAALFTALVVGAPALKDKPVAKPTIEGEWQVQNRTDSGKRTEDSNIWIFAPKGVAEIRDPAGARVISDLTYSTKAGTDLSAIDFMESQGNGRADPRLGIFKIDGDMLTFSFTCGAEQRPKTFDPGEAGSIVIVMKRVKK